MKQYFDDLKDYDGILIESHDKVVDINSVVCISPFNIKTGEWLCGLMVVTDMKTALAQNKRKITKDNNVEIFMKKHYKEAK